MEALEFVPLPEAQLKQLREEADVDVTDPNVIEDVRKWCVQQPPYLPEALFDDTLIINFILLTRSAEKAREKIVNDYRTKIEHADWILPCDPCDEIIKKRIRMYTLITFPTATVDGNRIIYIKPFIDADIFEPADFLLFLSMYISLYWRIGAPEANGLFIVDYAGASLQHIAKHTPSIIKLMNTYIKNVPMRVKCAIYLNVHPVIGSLINMISASMKEKVRSRIFIYSGGVENVTKHISPELVPIELGGTKYTLEQAKDMWFDKLVENRDFFLNQRNLLEKYVNLKNTSTQGSDVSTGDGVQGTFKKLCVD